MKNLFNVILATLCSLMVVSCGNGGNSSNKKIMFEDLDSTALYGIRDFLAQDEYQREMDEANAEMERIIELVQPGLTLSELADEPDVIWYIVAGRNGSTCTCKITAKIGGLDVATNFDYMASNTSFSKYLTPQGQRRFFSYYKPNTYRDGFKKEVTFYSSDFTPEAKVVKAE